MKLLAPILAIYIEENKMSILSFKSVFHPQDDDWKISPKERLENLRKEENRGRQTQAN